MQPTPPGWYWDPGNRPGLFRWWDGHGWTEALSANRTRAAPAPLDLPEPGAGGCFSGGSLTFPGLPEPWHPCPPYPKYLEAAAGQELVVGQTPRGPYLAAVFVGALGAELAGTDLGDATVRLGEAMLKTYYPHERPHAGFDPSAVEVAGRPACRLVVPLDVDDENLPFTAETVVALLVDVDRGAPGVLFASLPDVEHVPSADDVLAQVQLDPA